MKNREKVRIIGDGELIETMRKILKFNFENIDVLLIIGSSKMMIEARIFLGYEDKIDRINPMIGKKLEIPYIKDIKC